MRHRLAVLSTILLVALLPGAPARAEACPVVTSGVTVVVDFGAFGGGVVVGCAAGSPTSGLAALSAAGFDWTDTQRFPGLVCRIDGMPADQSCADAPPGDAYWSYWHAPQGGSWSYATAGPAAAVPEPGTVEGWAFSTNAVGAPPGVAPPSSPGTTSTTSTTTTTTTTTVQTTTTTAHATTTTSGSAATSAADLAGGPDTTVSASPSTTSSTLGVTTSLPSTTSPDQATTTGPAADTASGDEVDLATGTPSDPERRSGLVAVIGLTALVAGAGMWTLHRRGRR